MIHKLKPAGTAMSEKMKGKPEKLGLPSNEQIKNSVYAKRGKKISKYAKGRLL